MDRREGCLYVAYEAVIFTFTLVFIPYPERIIIKGTDSPYLISLCINPWQIVFEIERPGKCVGTYDIRIFCTGNTCSFGTGVDVLCLKSRFQFSTMLHPNVKSDCKPIQICVRENTGLV